MIIGFDAKRALNNMTGLGNYSRLVIENVARLNPECKILLYAPEPRENPRMSAIKSLPNVEFRFPPSQGFQGTLWRTFGVTNNLRSDKVTVYHGLSNELPLNIRDARGVRSVVTIHDLIYRRLPWCYSPVDRLLYDFKYGRACRNADRIIAVSECTKRDIMHYYNVEEDKIRVIYQGCDDIFRHRADNERDKAVARELQLPERYILQVGTVERRKNLELTMRALAALPEDLHLVVVGRDHHGYRRKCVALAKELGITARVKWLEGLPFDRLPGLYRGAAAAAYPSLYEGFGIPVLEALECGTPVVAAKGSCLEEAGGGGTLYVAPDSPREMAEALRSCIDGSRDRREIAAIGRAHAARFSTARMAGELAEAYLF